MEINLEKPQRYSIQGYSEQQIQVAAETYTSSLIISKDKIIEKWDVHALSDINAQTLAPILDLNPEIIIIGHNHFNEHLPIPALQHVINHHIGIECMLLGPACRTFNVLLAEDRHVVAGIIL